jgi:hypothetical protein
MFGGIEQTDLFAVLPPVADPAALRHPQRRHRIVARAV